jgi:hypothetical protein
MRLLATFIDSSSQRLSKADDTPVHIFFSNMAV